MKEKPPWIKDSISISDKAKRLQGLCDDEIERRRKRRGIPREHWKYVGLEETKPKPTKVSHLRVVEAEVEILEPAHGGGKGGGLFDKQKPSWDFYFFIGSLGLAFVLGSYLFVGAVVTLLRDLF